MTADPSATGGHAAADEVHVAFGTDDGAALPLAVTLSSLGRSTTRRVTAHVLTHSLTGRHRRRLERVGSSVGVQVRIHDVDESAFDGFPTSFQWSLGTYLRLVVGEALPQALERVVYLDADLLVRRDIGALYDLALNGHPVAALTTSRDPQTVDRYLDYCRDERPPSVAMFNAGVMLVDLRLWRASESGQEAAAFLRRHRDSVRQVDQDALNALFGHDFEPLNASWNVMLGRTKNPNLFPSQKLIDVTLPFHQASLDQPAIYHFVTSFKPWSKDGLRHRFGGQWHAELRRSGWFDSSMEVAAWYARWFSANAIRMTRDLPMGLLRRVRGRPRYRPGGWMELKTEGTA
ncbi:MAG: glycosyltransferase family 8 protein [Planctomycetota bacterium]